MADTLLDVDGIETCYGLSQVLFGLSLSVKRGEMVSLMGRNGMGKTTTIRSIMGLTPARAGREATSRSSAPAIRSLRCHIRLLHVAHATSFLASVVADRAEVQVVGRLPSATSSTLPSVSR